MWGYEGLVRHKLITRSVLIVPSGWFLPIPLSERAEKQFCQNLGSEFFYHSPDYSHAIPQVEHGRQRFEAIPLNLPIFTQLSSYLHDRNYLEDLRA